MERKGEGSRADWAAGVKGTLGKGTEKGREKRKTKSIG